MIIFPKTLCVLFSGRAGVGKTTSALHLGNYLMNEFKLSGGIVSIAHEVKQLAKVGYGWDGIKDSKGRKLLQDVGRVGREYNEDIWISKALKKIETVSEFPPDFFIFDDWRFLNEKIAIEKTYMYHIITIRIEAPTREILAGTSSYNDISEVSLPPITLGDKPGVYDGSLVGYDYAINNVGTFDDLYDALESLINVEVWNLNINKEEQWK